MTWRNFASGLKRRELRPLLGHHFVEQLPADRRHWLFGLQILATQLTYDAHDNLNANATPRRRLALHDGLTSPGSGFGSEICVAHLELVSVFNDADTIDY